MTLPGKRVLLLLRSVSIEEVKITDLPSPPPSLSVKASVLYCFREMFGSDALADGQIGDRATYLQNPLIGPGRQMKTVHGGLKQFFSGGIDPADFFQEPVVHLRVAIDASMLMVSLLLNRTCCYYPLAYLQGGLFFTGG